GDDRCHHCAGRRCCGAVLLWIRGILHVPLNRKLLDRCVSDEVGKDNRRAEPLAQYPGRRDGASVSDDAGQHWMGLVVLSNVLPDTVYVCWHDSRGIQGHCAPQTVRAIRQIL
ncbi:hypothetical protein EV175_006941, partial [Coemansia sp. RSA 1933]